ncbi:thiopurine S-methyltransferase [Shewanella woodyi]|uniref:Thiopurine S-methyltransferase n=1 Tax=Shewanella woodyi (strain ATCC 51908 / MS32) TaxID=392500 RepID=B1KQV0_SHEWM|nr:thiopurine S-methyltransferase [Shewanella woodyi]ACA87706.1 Thiopurine S-methyltransferase [Shewanella woodyi ATCC 51908]
MKASFWHERWERGEIAFHEQEINCFLAEHLSRLGVRRGGRILVPLCGKTRDIEHLLSCGYQVVGVELNQQAVEALFIALGLTPNVTKVGDFTLYRAANIDLFVGDIFALSSELVGAVDGIYDRAALVALPFEMRKRYSSHLIDITCGAPQLLVIYTYDQTLMDGPPFSISCDEVELHYSENYCVNQLDSRDAPGGIRGKISAIESAWLLIKDD